MPDEKTEHTPSAAGGSHAHRGGGHGIGGHGGGHEEAHEGAPEWLISFADNVMLQMGFFVILFAIAMKEPRGAASAATSNPNAKDSKPGPTADQLDWAIALREAFNNPVDPTSTDPNDFLLVQRLAARAGESKANTPGPPGQDHDVQSIRPGDYFGQGGVVSFERDSAELNGAAQKTIAGLLEHLRGHNNVVEIRGHVSAPEAFNQADRGMNLSYQRAHTVAEALVAGGVSWKQIHLMQLGDNDRVAQGHYDAQVHEANQRVEVIITDVSAEPAAEPQSSIDQNK